MNECLLFLLLLEMLIQSLEPDKTPSSSFSGAQESGSITAVVLPSIPTLAAEGSRAGSWRQGSCAGPFQGAFLLAASPSIHKQLPHQSRVFPRVIGTYPEE